MSRIQAHRRFLLDHHLTRLEARMLSILPKSTPALKALVADREARWERFQKVANGKVARGKWWEKDLPKKWLSNLSRLYYKRGWRVKEGAKGAQQKMAKYSPNPWAMYRTYIKGTGGIFAQGYLPEWTLRKWDKGKSKFDRGQLFIQKAEKGAQKDTIQHWIDQLTESIRMYPAKRAQFVKQRQALRKML